MNKTVVIFGVFDGIHEGHLAFIKEAKLQGENLVAIVARDSVVFRLKGHLPFNDESSRVKSLLELNDIKKAFLGDDSEGEYKILREIKPDLIYLGYDQKFLYEDISLAIKNNLLPKMEIMHGNPHKPDIFHTSLLRKK